MRMVLKFKSLIVVSLMPMMLYAQTADTWTIPLPYREGNQMLEGRGAQSITKDKDGVVYLYVSENQISSQSSDTWMTKCSKSVKKGISFTSCLIQNPSNKSINVLVSANGTLVTFLPFRVGEINYRVGNERIKTLSKNYFMYNNIQFDLISDLLKSKSMTYSYEVNNSYKSKEVSLDGFAENYGFSTAFIRAN